MNKTIYDFGKEMNKQLTKHNKEKTDIKTFNLAEIWGLTSRQIEERLKILNTMGPHDMEKQCVHMANYLFFLWRKLNED